MLKNKLITSYLLLLMLFPLSAVGQKQEQRQLLCKLMRQDIVEPYVANNANGYLNSASFISTVAGIPLATYLINDLNELRHLPFTRSKMTLLAVVDSDHPLTRERLDRVVAIAQRKGLTIHVVWRGLPLEDNLPLIAILANQTNGAFIDWSSIESEACRFSYPNT